jgi:hypothetical protein
MSRLFDSSFCMIVHSILTRCSSGYLKDCGEVFQRLPHERFGYAAFIGETPVDAPGG